MDNQQEHATFEQWVEHVSDTILRQDFMLRSLTAEVERLRKLVPNGDPEKIEEGEPGQVRGNSTAFRLPGGWGSLVVTIGEDGRGTVKYQNAGHTEKVGVQLRKH